MHCICSVGTQAARAWSALYRGKLHRHGERQQERRGACRWLRRRPVLSAGFSWQQEQGVRRKRCCYPWKCQRRQKFAYAIMSNIELGYTSIEWVLRVYNCALCGKCRDAGVSGNRSLKLSAFRIVMPQSTASVEQSQPVLGRQFSGLAPWADRQASAGLTDPRLVLGVAACCAALLALVQRRSLRRLLKRMR